MHRSPVTITLVLAVCVLWTTGCQATVAQRVEAARQLALAKDPTKVPEMKAALADPAPVVRRLAIYALERVGDPANAQAILPLLADGDAWVRRTAITALGKLGNRAAVPALIGCLDDDSVHVRLEAFVALGRIGDPACQKAVAKAMKDTRLWGELALWDEMAILQAVDRPFFTDRDVVPVLKWILTYGEWEHPEFKDLEASRRERYGVIVGNRAAEILATKFGDASGEALIIKGLAPGDDYMQQSSARAAAAIKSKKAVPALVKMLQETEWINNKQYALDALGEIGDKSALPALDKFVSHDDVGLRAAAAKAWEKITGKTFSGLDLSAPAAAIPEVAQKDLGTPGNKRPPMLICLGVDDCANIEGLEAMLDICETLKAQGSKAVFTMWVAPLAGDWKSRDNVKHTLLLQRLFDLGCEFAHHTLHHNPGGKWWGSLPKEQQREEILGLVDWFHENIDGYTRPFSYKGGGGASGGWIDRQYSQSLLKQLNLLYRGRRGQHPNDQLWPQKTDGAYAIPTGMQDGNAPPVHAKVTRPIRSDYPGQFDYPLASGVAMMKANFDYRYRHPRRPIFAINACHDWGFKTPHDSTSKGSHRNEAAIIKEFLLEVLVRDKAKYPDTHCVTFRQVVEYVHTDGNLEHTLAAGNCQDSRNPVKPSIE